MGLAEAGQSTFVGHVCGAGNPEYGESLNTCRLSNDEKEGVSYLNPPSDDHPQLRQMRQSPWRSAVHIGTTAGAICTQAAAALIISGYQPSRSSADMQAQGVAHGNGEPTGAKLKQCQDICSLWLGTVSRLLRNDRVRPGALWNTTREILLNPSPGLLVISCASYTLILVYRMQDSQHRCYQNYFITLGAVFGLFLGILCRSADAFPTSVLTAYAPFTVMVAQILSSLLHTIFVSWQDPIKLYVGEE